MRRWCLSTGWRENQATCHCKSEGANFTLAFVITRIRSGGTFIDDFITDLRLSLTAKRILKVGQELAKLRTKIVAPFDLQRLGFFATPCGCVLSWRTCWHQVYSSSITHARLDLTTAIRLFSRRQRLRATSQLDVVMLSTWRCRVTTRNQSINMDFSNELVLIVPLSQRDLVHQHTSVLSKL